MLKGLRLENVGPIPSLDVEFGSRLNLLTGDNGLGKTFLLDICWWALTRKWPNDLNAQLTSGFAARPTDPTKKATIGFTVDGKSKSDLSYESIYAPRDEAWQGKSGRPPSPGLVIYVHSDGGFSVWDPARNYWLKKGNIDTQDRLPAYVFSPKQVWEGLTISDLTRGPLVACNGLLSDWAGWIKAGGNEAWLMTHLVSALLPKGERFEIDGVTRLSVNDARDIPAVRPPYGGSVPIVHASSGIRRAVALAYMLHWSWLEHIRATILLGESPTNQVVLLFDEIESHLHPRWQRTILSSVLEIAGLLHADAKIQLVAATHSPLILASAEPLFNEKTDSWFDFDLAGQTVSIQKRDFQRKGDVSAWLTSEAFDLKEARSQEAESAIVSALAILRSENPVIEEVRRVNDALRSSLGETDRFWLRWSDMFDRQTANSDSTNDPR
jgi:AAA domain, putative AbiEii toxin, Type IV TA system